MASLNDLMNKYKGQDSKPKEEAPAPAPPEPTPAPAPASDDKPDHGGIVTEEGLRELGIPPILHGVNMSTFYVGTVKEVAVKIREMGEVAKNRGLQPADILAQFSGRKLEQGTRADLVAEAQVVEPEERDAIPAASNAGQVQPPEAPENATPEPLDQRELTAKWLKKTDGIGKAGAESIMEYCEKEDIKTFRDLSDLHEREIDIKSGGLLRLPGVGEKSGEALLESLKEELALADMLPDVEADLSTDGGEEAGGNDESGPGTPSPDQSSERSAAPSNAPSDSSTDQPEPTHEQKAILLIGCHLTTGFKPEINIRPLLICYMEQVAQDLGLAHYNLADYRKGPRRLAAYVANNLDDFVIAGSAIYIDPSAPWASEVIDVLDGEFHLTIRG